MHKATQIAAVLVTLAAASGAQAQNQPSQGGTMHEGSPGQGSDQGSWGQGSDQGSPGSSGSMQPGSQGSQGSQGSGGTMQNPSGSQGTPSQGSGSAPSPGRGGGVTSPSVAPTAGFDGGSFLRAHADQLQRAVDASNQLDQALSQGASGSAEVGRLTQAIKTDIDSAKNEFGGLSNSPESMAFSRRYVTELGKISRRLDLADHHADSLAQMAAEQHPDVARIRADNASLRQNLTDVLTRIHNVNSAL